MSENKPEGYLAAPAAAGGKPVLVLHAWWGLNDTIKGICDRLAQEGYLAFAPDLYQGKVATTIPQAKEYANALDDGEAWSEISKAMQWLSEKSGEKVAVMGFSLGAYFALQLSNDDVERVRSVVVFYGTGPEEFAKSKAAYQGHFAEKDEFEPKEGVDGLKKLLEDAGRSAEFYTYPGTGHWFFEPDREDAYNEAAAKLAWEQTLEFLKQQFS